MASPFDVTFPNVLLPAIQQGYLEREFLEPLKSVVAYRSIADREEFPSYSGETITKTRRGLLTPVTTFANPSQINTNFDNGMSPNNWGVEQFTLTLGQLNDTLDLNLAMEKIGIKKRFLDNARAQGEQAKQSLDRVARNALFNGYMGGNTRVTTTLGSAGTTVRVDDLRGFVQVPGVGAIGTIALSSPTAPLNASPTMLPVSQATPLTVTIGANVYSVIGYAADANNISTTAITGGVSGTLTCSTNVTVADGTIGNTVQAATACTMIRPSGRANTGLLQATDTISLAAIMDAVQQLRANAVPELDGAYNCYLPPKSERQLFADPEFQLLYRGTGFQTPEYKQLNVKDGMGIRFIRTTEVFLQPATWLSSGINVYRPILAGKGALVEGVFVGGMDDAQGGNQISYTKMVDGIKYVVRPPLDRLSDIIAQSWKWIGGFCTPSDVLTNANIVPTASNAALKRAIVIEHVG
jgi:hypothetical protein